VTICREAAPGPEPTPTPTPTPAVPVDTDPPVSGDTVPPTPDLPRTGTAPALAILTALLLVAAGTGLVARRARRA
jgi:LPXTG-motif cell wall-anchored protein